MKNVVRINGINDINRAAAEFLEKIGDKKVIAFYASMGAGKTTFTAALCSQLGVLNPVCSPTFTIVNEYLTESDDLIYHFDFYRINKLSEAVDIGFEGYIYSGYLCLIEWAENIEELLPDDCLRVYVEVEADLSRTIRWDDNCLA